MKRCGSGNSLVRVFVRVTMKRRCGSGNSLVCVFVRVAMKRCGSGNSLVRVFVRVAMKRCGSGNSLNRLHVFQSKNLYKHEFCSAVRSNVLCESRSSALWYSVMSISEQEFSSVVPCNVYVRACC